MTTAQSTTGSPDQARMALTRATHAVSTYNGTVQAWVHLDLDHAARQATRLDTAASGLLYGLTLAVKDVIDTVDMPTAYGSALYDGFQPAADASCVALARAAGALVLGKTVSTEFAFIAPGATRHPLDASRTPGGSSSGSAAAVACGMADIALGTQTSGSTIRPAAFCGIVGYKPSYGYIDRSGVKTLCENLDTLGLFARTVDPLARLATVLNGRDMLAGFPPVTPRIGLFRPPGWALAQNEAREAVETAARRLAETGAHVTLIDDPGSHEALLDAHTTVMAWEVPRALAYERLAGTERLKPQTRERIQLQPGLNATAYDRAWRVIFEERARWQPVLEGLDAILSLPASGEAPTGFATGDPIFNRAWTALGVPCITLPIAKGCNGLPLGLQCIGAMGSDARLIATARFIENCLGTDMI
ncbi:amidase [Acetobacter sp.]|uniref:amidase n=1 Tax=Acetobacter sp. TaxID=440 RepID=UPI0039E7FC68